MKKLLMACSAFCILCGVGAMEGPGIDRAVSGRVVQGTAAALQARGAILDEAKGAQTLAALEAVREGADSILSQGVRDEVAALQARGAVLDEAKAAQTLAALEAVRENGASILSQGVRDEIATLRTRGRILDDARGAEAAYQSDAVDGDQAWCEKRTPRIKRLSAADLAEQQSGAASVTPGPSPMEQHKAVQSASVDLSGQSGTAPVANTSSSPTGQSDAKPKKGLFGCCMPRRRSRGEAL